MSGPEAPGEPKKGATMLGFFSKVSKDEHLQNLENAMEAETEQMKEDKKRREEAAKL